MQVVLRKLTHLMGLLAGHNEVLAAAEAELAEPGPTQRQRLWAAVQFGIQNLTEGGIGTLALIVGLIVYGVLTSALLLSPALLTSVLIAALFFQESFKSPSAPVSMPTIVALGALGFSIFLLPFIDRGRGLQSRWGKFCILLAALSALCLVGEALPHLLPVTGEIGGPAVLFLSVVAAPVVLGALGLWLGVASRAGRVVLGLFTVIGPLLMLAAFLWLVDIFVVGPSEHSLWRIGGLFVIKPSEHGHWLLGGLTLASWLYSSFALNINTASPHAFYRDRLARLTSSGRPTRASPSDGSARRS